MEINYYVVGGVVLFGIVLVVFLVRRNLRDKEKLEVFLDKTVNSLKKEESEVNDGKIPIDFSFTFISCILGTRMKRVPATQIETDFLSLCKAAKD